MEHAPLPEPLPTVRPASPRARAQAVVIGAGMGGLATAAALRRHVDRVTIVERDDLPSIPAARSGVPQGRHLHALQPGGLAALDRLIPGFRSELVAAGAVSLTVPRDVLWMSAAGWMQPFPGRGRTMVSGSRELIEFVARRMVLADPGITVRPGVEVAALAVESGRVVGVDVRPRGSAPSEPASDWVSGELVVDASGRRSSAPEWLAAAGYDRPAETVVDATLAYSTRIYRRTGDELVPGYRAVFLQARPPHTTRMAVMFPIEGDRWMLTLAGTSGDLPPTDEAGFLDFARGLRSPVVADAIERLDPISPVVGYRRTANRRRHFEDLRRAPDGFVAVGDAACAFNPVYAQGMTAAALTAEAVERSLAGHRGRHAGALAGASTAMQKAVARANAGPWTIATGEDLRYPATTGGSSSVPERLIRRYMDRLVAAAATDPEVNAAFFDVIAVLAEPSTLLRPSMSLRVLGRRHPVPPARPARPRPTPPHRGGRLTHRRAKDRIAVLRRHPLPPAPRRRPPLPAHAVVIGAGLGGLAAAQALARHVERVTVIERDDLPDRPGPRPGVPQSRHVHALQPGGLVALERLLPGCAAEMRAAGAVALRVPEDLCWLAAGGWMPPVPARDGRMILSASRDLIEWTVRRRVLESPQVLVRSGLEVCGLAVDRGRTTGVQVRSRRAGTAGPVVTICADLVVDAGGRRSPAPEWFAAAGIAPPAETVIDSGLAYASRIYRRTDGDAGGRKAILLQGQPPERPRTGLAMPIERGRWMVTVSSAGGDVPPTHEAGFLAFARSLRSSEVADLLSRAEPLGPIAAYRRTQNRRLRYEDLARPLEGFLATGDALCSFNPVYAQGMSTAAMAAAALDEALDAHLATRRDLAGFTAGAQRALAATCEGAWKVATGVDLRFPTVRGDARGRRARAVDNLMGRYMARVGRAATVDPAVTYALYDVIALLAPPQTLLRPAVARRVLVRRQAPGTPRARREGGLAAEPAAMTPT